MQFIPQQLQFYSSNWSPNGAITLNIYKQQCYRHQIFGLRTKQINVYPLFYFIIFLTYLILFSNFKCDKPQKNSFIMLKIKLFSPFAQTLLERERERENTFIERKSKRKEVVLCCWFWEEFCWESFTLLWVGFAFVRRRLNSWGISCLIREHAFFMLVGLFIIIATWLTLKCDENMFLVILWCCEQCE